MYPGEPGPRDQSTQVGGGGLSPGAPSRLPLGPGAFDPEPMTPLAFLAPVLLAAQSWLAPVAPLVVERPFIAPADAYSPGHRGVDLRADPGQPVRSPASGIVRVAGRVAGKAVIAIEHPHRILGRTGWRTTYESVNATVEVGQRVQRGAVIGTVARSDGHADGLHWGLKNGRRYADPALLLRHTIVLKPLGPAGP